MIIRIYKLHLLSGHKIMGPEHLLLGALSQVEVATALVHLGVDPNGYREKASL